MAIALPDGEYPFIDQRLPRDELVMIEAPIAMEQLFRAQAAANGIEIARGIAVELRCQSAEYPDAMFLIYWAFEDERLHMLVPKKSAKGLA